MFHINERKVSLGQKGVIRRYQSQLLCSSSNMLKASIVFFFILLCLFFAVLWGINFSKFLSIATMH